MDDDKSTLWVIIIAVLLILWFAGSGSSDSGYYDGCYDADPTQWTDIVCE